MGLGSGRVTSVPAGIDCGPDATCEATFPNAPPVVVTASPEPDSSFEGWEEDPEKEGPSPDCSGTTNPCTLTMNTHRSLRPKFRLNTAIAPLTIFDTTTSAPATRVFGPTDVLAPQEVIRQEDIDTYLAAHTDVTSPARFIAALPPEFKLNWILMTRSESLQTGTAQSPRLLLPSADGRFVFTIGMTEHSSYPGSHPNAIEFMQWDADQKNFRFHEIVLNLIPIWMLMAMASA